MGPKQRKSIDASANPIAASWNTFTKTELIQILGDKNISIDVEKPLKSDLIKLVEDHLTIIDCIGCLKKYDRPISAELEDILSVTNKKKYGRKSTPAFLAVANNEASVKQMEMQISSPRLRRRSRSRMSINGDFSYQSPESIKIKSRSRSKPARIKVLSGSNSDNIIGLTNSNRTSSVRFYSLVILSFSIITFIILSYSGLGNSSVYFCDKSVGSKVQNECTPCPVNAACIDGKVKCDKHYRLIVPLSNKSSAYCMYDDKAHDLTEDMLHYLAKKLKRLEGMRQCSIISNSEMPLEEARQLISAKYGDSNDNTMQNAKSILWKQIQRKIGIQRHRIDFVEFPTKNSDSYEHLKGFLIALDGDRPLTCVLSSFIYGFSVITFPILTLFIMIYLLIKNRNMKRTLKLHLKDLIVENTSVGQIGTAVGPSVSDLTILAKSNFPQYKSYLNDKTIEFICQQIEKSDSSICKTSCSDGRPPFYWSSIKLHQPTGIPSNIIESSIDGNKAQSPFGKSSFYPPKFATDLT